MSISKNIPLPWTRMFSHETLPTMKHFDWFWCILADFLTWVFPEIPPFLGDACFRTKHYLQWSTFTKNRKGEVARARRFSRCRNLPGSNNKFLLISRGLKTCTHFLLLPCSSVSFVLSSPSSSVAKVTENWNPLISASRSKTIAFFRLGSGFHVKTKLNLDFRKNEENFWT